MSLVSNKPVLSGSLKSVRLVSLKFSKKLIIASLVSLVSQSVSIEWAAAQSGNTQNAVSARWQNLLQAAKIDKDKQAYKSAEEKLLRAMALVKGNDLNRYIETLDMLSDVADSADWDAKELSYRKAIVELCQMQKPAIPQMPLFNYRLGLAYYHNKKYQQAYELAQPAIAQMANHFGANNPYLANMYLDLSMVIEKTGNKQLAREYQDKGEKINDLFVEGLQRSIKRAWHPPKSNLSTYAVTFFTVKPDGKLTNVRIQKSSGNKEYDDICLKAVENASTPLITWSYFKPTWDICSEFNFDYNVFNGGDGRGQSGPSNSDARLKATRARLADDLEKLKQRLASVKKHSAQLNDEDLSQIMGLTDLLRDSNNAKENELITDSLRQTPGYSEKDSQVKLFVDALPGLDYARMSKLTEAETTLKPIVENPHFEDLPSKIKIKILKCYGDVLYKQNKIEQAEAVYTQIKTLQRK